MPKYEHGTYMGNIVGQGFGESANKGTPYFYVDVRVNQKQERGTPDFQSCEEDDRRVTFYLTENTAKIVVDELRSMGFEGQSFTQLDPETADYQDLTGTEVRLSCEHEQSQDGQKTYERWRLARQRAEVKPLEAKAKRKLDALFGKHLSAASPAMFKAPAGVNGQKTPTLAQSTIEMPTGDDIPF